MRACLWCQGVDTLGPGYTLGWTQHSRLHRTVLTPDTGRVRLIGSRSTRPCSWAPRLGPSHDIGPSLDMGPWDQFLFILDLGWKTSTRGATLNLDYAMPHLIILLSCLSSITLMFHLSFACPVNFISF